MFEFKRKRVSWRFSCVLHVFVRVHDSNIWDWGYVHEKPLIKHRFGINSFY